MEKLKRNFREALKQEHEDLTDEEIELSEKLLAQRFLINPEKEPERIAEIDRQRAELLRRKMPRYKAVVEKVREQERKR